MQNFEPLPNAFCRNSDIFITGCAYYSVLQSTRQQTAMATRFLITIFLVLVPLAASEAINITTKGLYPEGLEYADHSLTMQNSLDFVIRWHSAKNAFLVSSMTTGKVS